MFWDFEVRRVACRHCGSVKRERLDFLADNRHFTKRFAFYVGRRCRQASIRDVSKELKLDWETVKTLEMQYMRAQLKRAGTPGPRAIGIDEIAIRKGHSYGIVVSDLVRKRPIWFGGEVVPRPAWRRSMIGWGSQKSRKSNGLQRCCKHRWTKCWTFAAATGVMLARSARLKVSLVN